METNYLKKVLVVLNLSKHNNPNFIIKARAIIASITGNDNFTTPLPTLASITTLIDEFEAAVAQGVIGTKADRVIVKNKRRAIGLTFDNLRGYVQNIVNADIENGEAIATSSGMNVKRLVPRQKQIFFVENTGVPGSVYVFAQTLKGGMSYEFQYSATPQDLASFVTWDITTRASITILELISGTLYGFRYAVITKNGKQPYSNVLTIIVL